MPILTKPQYQELVTQYIQFKEAAGTQREKDLWMERIAEIQFKIAELNRKEKGE